MSTRYHRLARETPAYAWWKLPVAGVLGVVLYVGLALVMLLVALAAFAVGSGVDRLDEWEAASGDLDPRHLDFFALDMIGLALLIPALLLAVLITGPRPIGYLSSVAGRLRWRWLGRTAVIAFVVFVATIGAALALGEALDPAEVGTPEVTPRILVAIALVLLLTPFQAAAEEYVFRGYVLQLVGSWTRFAFIPVIVSVPLFVIGHEYELWGLIDVGIFGLMAAVVTIRTGGLEAAIAAHTANNIVLLVLDALGMISATDDSGAGPADVVPTVVSSVMFLVWVDWAARRHGLQRTRPPMPPPPPPQAPMWPPPPYAYWWPTQQAPAPPWPSPPRTAPVPPPAAPQVHPHTPDYPGEVPPDWASDRR